MNENGKEATEVQRNEQVQLQTTSVYVQLGGGEGFENGFDWLEVSVHGLFNFL